MKKLIAFFAILSIILLIPFQSFATIKKLGQTGLKFLSVGVGARAAGMGEAFTIVGDGANALFYNPAGVAQMNSHFDFTVSVTDWISDVSYNAIGFVLNGGNWGNFGISIISPDYGIIGGTQVAPTEAGYKETGLLDVGAFAGGLSYARQITNKFRIGGQIKYASQHLGSNLIPMIVGGEMAGTELKDNKVSGLAYDLGTIFYPKFSGIESFGFGMSIRNFSPQFKYAETAFQLPLTFTIGFAMDILDLYGKHPDQFLLVEIDALHPRDYSERLHLGAEYSYKDMMTVRTGYKFNYDEEGLTFGVGFNFGGLKLDYAYGDFGVFNVMNRISLGMAF